ncbi:Ig-like domain-containing protein, partial [Bacteroidota bacterium]
YNSERRILWHNIESAEQNYGLKGFRKNNSYKLLKEFPLSSTITNIKASSDFSFLRLELGLKDPLENPDELWITFDTYGDMLGESKLPAGETIPYRSEFALQITNYSASLYVTEAYDLFGIWHGTSGPKQLYHSVLSDGNPWYIERWKNNSGHSDVQYVGDLQLNYQFQPSSSKDAVVIYEDKIRISIPWSLLHFVDPSQMRVFNDSRSNPGPKDTITNGINIAVLSHGTWFAAGQKYDWSKWNKVDSTEEYFKTSYWIMKERLHEFNTKAIAVKDSFYFSGADYPVWINADDGLLKNDFDLDGNQLQAMITENPKNGQITLYNDGSFSYQPNAGFNGSDTLKYCLFDGFSLSVPNTAIIYIENNNSIDENSFATEDFMHIYPNPCRNYLTIETIDEAREMIIFNQSGNQVMKKSTSGLLNTLRFEGLPAGSYYVLAKLNNLVIYQPFVIL